MQIMSSRIHLSEGSKGDPRDSGGLRSFSSAQNQFRYVWFLKLYDLNISQWILTWGSRTNWICYLCFRCRCALFKGESKSLEEASQRTFIIGVKLFKYLSRKSQTCLQRENSQRSHLSSATSKFALRTTPCPTLVWHACSGAGGQDLIRLPEWHMCLLLMKNEVYLKTPGGSDERAANVHQELVLKHFCVTCL